MEGPTFVSDDWSLLEVGRSWSVGFEGRDIAKYTEVEDILKGELFVRLCILHSGTHSHGHHRRTVARRTLCAEQWQFANHVVQS